MWSPWTGKRLHLVVERDDSCVSDQCLRLGMQEFRSNRSKIREGAVEQTRRFGLWAGELSRYDYYDRVSPITEIIQVDEECCYLIVTRRAITDFGSEKIVVRTLEAVMGNNYCTDPVNPNLIAGHDPARGYYYTTQLLVVLDTTDPDSEFRFWPALPKSERKGHHRSHEDIFGAMPHYGKLTDDVREMSVYAFIAYCEKLLGKFEFLTPVEPVELNDEEKYA